MSNLRKIKKQLILSQATLNVVQVPEVVFSLPGRKGRRIFIEAFNPADKVQAQRDALALSKIMKERIFKKGKLIDDRPLILPAVFDNSDG